MDDFRKRQLEQMDTHRLRECAAWGGINAAASEETQFAKDLLKKRERDEELLSVLNAAADFIQPFNRGEELLDRIDAEIAKLRGES